jgi:Uma2 family endonuclease
LGQQRAYATAPEICVEVISPCNFRQELDHEKGLYFEAGALVVWFCSQEGALPFFLGTMPNSTTKSLLAPEIPLQIETF